MKPAESGLYRCLDTSAPTSRFHECSFLLYCRFLGCRFQAADRCRFGVRCSSVGSCPNRPEASVRSPILSHIVTNAKPAAATMVPVADCGSTELKVIIPIAEVTSLRTLPVLGCLMVLTTRSACRLSACFQTIALAYIDDDSGACDVSDFSLNVFGGNRLVVGNLRSQCRHLCDEFVDRCRVAYAGDRAGETL